MINLASISVLFWNESTYFTQTIAMVSKNKNIVGTTLKSNSTLWELISANA